LGWINEQIAAFGRRDAAGISPEVACIGVKPSSRAKICATTPASLLSLHARDRQLPATDQTIARIA
jgi:hypothetical protein